MTTEQITACLANKAHPQHAAAADLAMQLGEQAAPAAAVLAAHTGDSDIGEPCIEALENLGPPPAAALADLTALLTHEELPAYWAATLLGRLAEQAAPAVAPLASVAAGSGPLAVRERAVWALSQIGPAASAALPALQSLSHSPQPRLARLAKQAMEATNGGGAHA